MQGREGGDVRPYVEVEDLQKLVSKIEEYLE